METVSLRSELVTSAGRRVCHFNLLVIDADAYLKCIANSQIGENIPFVSRLMGFV